jgi:hypothetical protein
MHHHVLRAQPGGRLAAPANDLRHLAIARRQGQVHRLARGAGGAMKPGRGVSRCCEIVAERRMVGLRHAQHGLVGQGQFGQVTQVLRWRLAGAKAACRSPSMRRHVRCLRRPAFTAGAGPTLAAEAVTALSRSAMSLRPRPRADQAHLQPKSGQVNNQPYPFLTPPAIASPHGFAVLLTA